MKIVYYTHTYFFDCDLPLIHELKALGHEVYLFFEIVPYALQSSIISIDKQYERTGIFPLSIYPQFDSFSNFVDIDKSFVLNRLGKIYSLSNLYMRYKFFKLIKDINPDILFCTDFIDIIDRPLYKYRDIIVQLVHDPFPHIGECNYRKTINRSYAFPRIKKFVLLNKNQAKDFSEKFNIPLTSIYFNKLGTYDCIHLYKNDNNILSLEGPIVLFCGRISPYKGIDYLLSAMKLVHQVMPSIHLVVAGAGEYNFDVTEYNKSDYIHFINRYITNEELYSLLNISKCVVCPYIEATQSGVVMTSLTMGVPLIVTNVGGLPEMVKHNQTGIVVPPKDSNSLAIAISKLYKDTSFYNLLKRTIKYENQEGVFSWNIIANQYIKIFEN